MRIFLIIIVASILQGNIYSQNISVKVLFEKEGNETLITDLSAKWILDGDTTVAPIKDNSILIPKSLFGRKGKAIISINKTTFTFDNFVVAWNEELPQWKLVVDYKPFDKEKYWSIKKWKKVKVIYALDYGNGKQITEYRFKKI